MHETLTPSVLLCLGLCIACLGYMLLTWYKKRKKLALKFEHKFKLVERK